MKKLFFKDFRGNQAENTDGNEGLPALDKAWLFFSDMKRPSPRRDQIIIPKRHQSGMAQIFSRISKKFRPG
jgi:hypothetical protein